MELQPLVIIITLKIGWIIAYLSTYNETVQGAVMISPSGAASACSGRQLDITCTTNGTFIQWYIRPESENDASRAFTRTLSSLIVVTNVAPLMINSSTFSFSRVSATGSLPLTSRLVISPVSGNLNGTEVICEDVTAMVNSSATVINVITIGGDPDHVRDYEVEISYSEHFYKDNVTINLNFSQENPLVSFTITLASQLPALMIRNLHTSVSLPLFYNMQYNISVVASLCGKAIATNSVGLFYESCEDPNTTEKSLMITGYMIPAREGINITIYCPPGLELIGPNTSRCMGNGKWEPDPKETECIDTSTTLHLTSSTQRSLDTLHHDGKIAVASSVTVFAVASVLFFIVGFVCGHFRQKKRKQVVHPPAGNRQTQIPYYDDVVFKQELELKENVAYGPIR